MQLPLFPAMGLGCNCKDVATNYYDLNCRHLAAAEGCYSVVLWLLNDMSCNPNPVDRFKRTPLEVSYQ